MHILQEQFSYYQFHHFSVIHAPSYNMGCICVNQSLLMHVTQVPGGVFYMMSGRCGLNTKEPNLTYLLSSSTGQYKETYHSVEIHVRPHWRVMMYKCTSYFNTCRYTMTHEKVQLIKPCFIWNNYNTCSQYSIVWGTSSQNI